MTSANQLRHQDSGESLRRRDWRQTSEDIRSSYVPQTCNSVWIVFFFEKYPFNEIEAKTDFSKTFQPKPVRSSSAMSLLIDGFDAWAHFSDFCFRLSGILWCICGVHCSLYAWYKIEKKKTAWWAIGHKVVKIVILPNIVLCFARSWS